MNLEIIFFCFYLLYQHKNQYQLMIENLLQFFVLYHYHLIYAKQKNFNEKEKQN
jgi:hypothetical protein